MVYAIAPHFSDPSSLVYLVQQQEVIYYDPGPITSSSQFMLIKPEP